MAAGRQTKRRWQEGKRPWDGHGGTRAIKTTQGLLVDQRMFGYLNPPSMRGPGLYRGHGYPELVDVTDVLPVFLVRMRVKGVSGTCC